jgi:hypothetical protein
MDDPAERLGAGVEQRPAGVVLEACDRPPDAGLELGLEQHVADHAPFARDGLEREQPDARELVTGHVDVATPEQLVAAADGEDRRTALRGRADPVALGREARSDQRLLPVLAAADVEEVVLARHDRIVRPDRADIELEPAPGRSPRQDGDVAAVGVDVQVVRVQMADDDLHPRASQYGRTCPRSPTIRRSASIAV